MCWDWALSKLSDNEWSSNSRLQNPNASQSIMKIESGQNVMFFDSEKPLAYNA